MSGKEVLKLGLIAGFASRIGIEVADVVIEKIKEKINEHDED